MTDASQQPGNERDGNKGASVDERIASGEIDPTKDRTMPPTIDGKTYHGLPDSYPWNKEGFIESQLEHARHVEYQGISGDSEWRLRDGTKLVLWPGGAVFNEEGTLCGWLNLRMPS